MSPKSPDHEENLTLAVMFNKANNRLPEGYTITLSFTASGADLTLTGPDDEEIDVCRDDLTTGEVVDALIAAAIAHAAKEGG